MTEEEKEKERRIEKRILDQLKPHLDQIAANDKKIFEMVEENNKKTNEMWEIFIKSKGFWSVSGSLLKLTIQIGAAVLVVYGFFVWLKTGQK